MKLECVHADTCLSSYWGGHHLPHVQIEVWRGMSGKDIRQAIRYELSQGCVMGSSENARLLSADFVRPTEEKAADQLARAAYAAINRMKPAKKGTRKFFMDLEESEEGDESVYAFFVFVEIE